MSYHDISEQQTHDFLSLCCESMTHTYVENLCSEHKRYSSASVDYLNHIAWLARSIVLACGHLDSCQGHFERPEARRKSCVAECQSEKQNSARSSVIHVGKAHLYALAHGKSASSKLRSSAGRTRKSTRPLLRYPRNLPSTVSQR